MMRIATRILPLSLALLGCASGAPGTAGTPRGDDLDAFVTAQMTQRHIPGLSLAVIQGGRIVEARAYGVTDPGGSVPVTTSTLFQAGSISKPVSALGALHLVERGRLDLDADVNRALTTWKVPSNGFTAMKPVTLRGLLSHTAGLTVHGFPGYAVDAARPTVVQVLNGEPPTNTPPIRVDTTPGAIWRYSGGGYTVMQQMVADVTGKSFPEFMRETVLQPIGMTHSSFEQPLPPAMAAMTAGGQYGNGQPVKGRWHVYPEMAAAGLWTTPSDLARFAIEVQEAYAGRSSKVVSQATIRRMLTVEKQGVGLGLFLEGTGPTLRFSHGGRDEGFDASLNALAETGQGLVVMINANDNSNMMNRLVGFVAKKYGWPALASAYAPPARGTPIPAERLASITGRYEFSNNNMLTLGTVNGRLFVVSDGLPDEEFVSVGNDQFQSMDRDSRIGFVRNASGEITALTWTRAGNTRTVPRIGPLVSALRPQIDLDPALTARVDVALRAMAQGGAAVASAPALTPGAQRDFSRFGPWGPARGYRGVAFIAMEPVGGRGLERHGHPVEYVAYYKLTTDSGQRALLVHVTKDGLITDFDDVVD